MSFPSIPSVDRKEWKQMLSGEIQHQYTNYVLQVQTHQLRKDVVNNIYTEDQAVEKLHALCTKYALAVQFDFKQIFKTW